MLCWLVVVCTTNTERARADESEPIKLHVAVKTMQYVWQSRRAALFLLFSNGCLQTELVWQ